ncbi:DUF262 domain-containing protein [Acetobacteraceae bacterium]|nr:DUF262 domain-containing protein [Acetobacteraceae bacterium]
MNEWEFEIPFYQRSYAWGLKQLQNFREDLENQIEANLDDPYFYGAILYAPQKPKSEGFRQTTSDIIDGQQRLTTAMLFFASAHLLLKAEYPKNAEILEKILTTENHNPRLRLQKPFGIAAEQTDDAFFQRLITNGKMPKADTPAKKNLEQAKKYFNQWLGAIEDKTRIQKLTNALLKAEIWPHCIPSKESAARIFELQNDRGKGLTELEKLKASLMRMAYMKGDENSKKIIDQIYKNFAEINLLLEEITAETDGLEEDAILSHFLIGYKNDLTADEDGHLLPKEYEKNRSKYWQHIQHAIRYHFKNLKQNGKDVLEGITHFNKELRQAYVACRDILKYRKENDDLACHFIAQKKLYYFWPLFLKIQRLDGFEALKTVTQASAELNIAFIHTPKSNTGEAELRTHAFKYEKGHAEQCANKLRKYKENFSDQLQNALTSETFYQENKPAGYYILWRYENYLRRQNGGNLARIEWVNFNSDAKRGGKFTLDHIISQNPKDAAEKSWLNKKIGEDDNGDPIRNEYKHLHRFGNLAIVRHSINAKYGNEAALTKISDKKMGFREFISYYKLDEFIENDKWQAKAINNREKALIDFVWEELFRG